jgi:3-methylcrotonyl-CoA carboxylase alpha subunit
MKRIQKVLIANRGEIALRVIRSCHEMGIRTVAVFSDADVDSLHVKQADESVRIGAAPSNESYLCMDKIIEAAKKTGADAIHPGYGFLAENAGFATACADAGVIFIGPSPDAIAKMGSKKEAKAIVSKTGVPVIPGYNGKDQSTSALSKEARKMGFPVLVKASAGGGGKGMRAVHSDEELEFAIESARREAESSFGDGTLLIERYIVDPRHIEIQILGDEHGNVVHLFERECSIQRRHQKIIEESPSPAVDETLRTRMGEAAVEVANAIGYSNAGTVEFIVDPSGAFYFLEVNTRLQVEHPVTECVTGVDLVRAQIHVAQGGELEFAQDDLSQSGAAIECRIYAEDPDEGFLPASGHIYDWHLPESEGIRVDGSAFSGMDVSVFYDPMLAKIIAYGTTRSEAISRMTRALEHLSLQGIANNRAFLLKVLEHPEFLDGNIDTAFIDKYLKDTKSAQVSARVRDQSAVAATLHAQNVRLEQSQILPNMVTGFRNNRVSDQSMEFLVGEEVLVVSYRDKSKGRFSVRVGDGDAQEYTRVSVDGPDIVLEDASGYRCGHRVIYGDGCCFVHGAGGSITFGEKARFPEPEREIDAGGLTAPMPGKVVQLSATVGDEVAKGQTLVIMEAMKMEHSLCAPTDGVVSSVSVAEGQLVDSGQVLVIVEESA